MSQLTNDLCEVRIPTYRRPAWLRAALRSVLDQTHRNVVAIVFDDSPDREGQSVVDDLKDSRVLYRPNPKNLGGGPNTDQAFNPRPLAGGAYACVLDDDNWLLPDWSAANIALIRSSGAPIVLRNQEVWMRGHQDQTTRTDNTTRGSWFGGSDTVVSPLTLRSHLFFHEGISHGAMFWRTDLETDWTVGPTVDDAGLAEHCRTLQVVENVAYGATSLAAFTLMPQELLSRKRISAREFNIARQSLGTMILRAHGQSVIDRGTAIANRTGTQHAFAMTLAECGNVGSPVVRELGLLLAVKRAARGLARRVMIPNPLKAYIELPKHAQLVASVIKTSNV